MQQQGLAEQQLAVLRVFLQQAVEALQQAGAGVRVGFGGGQGEEVEVRVALALQHLLHVAHGLVVAAGTGQLHGGGALGVEAIGRAVGPDQRAVQGRLLGAQVLGDAEGALGHAGVAGGIGLLYIVAQCNVEAVALAGQLGSEQGVQGLFAERSVLLGLGRGLAGIGILHRRGAVRRGGQALAAGEQEGGSQQREGFVHKGKLRSVAWLHHDTSGGRKPTAPSGFAERVNLSRQLSCLG